MGEQVYVVWWWINETSGGGVIGVFSSLAAAEKEVERWSNAVDQAITVEIKTVELV